MSRRSRAALSLWRARTAGTTIDRAFALYLLLMLALVTMIPVGRAVWLSAASSEGFALLSDAAAPGVASLVVAALWAGALLLGTTRGPVVLPPLLTHALAVSDLPRFDAFRSPLLRSGVIVTIVCAVAAAVIATSLASHGLADMAGVARFIVVGAIVGVTSTVLWLVGQVFPRASVGGALGIVTIGWIGTIAPSVLEYAPWGWVGPAYPTGEAGSSCIALAALALSLVALVPTLMNRLGFVALTAQAARWDSATAHATGLDFSSAMTIYQTRPHAARHLRAVRPSSHLAWTFVVRDAIGALRTPGRLIAGILALAAACTLVVTAFAPGMPGWLLGCVAGLIVFAGLGPLTEGIRHAASAVADFPLYGIGDERLIAYHTLFPLAVTVTVTVGVVAVGSAIMGVGIGAPMVGALALGLMTIIARVNNALKGGLPTVLLTPVPTAAGDPMAAVRILWALDAIVLSALARASAVLLFEAPIFGLSVGAAVIATGISRWRGRR
ncbi:MAG: hypothetical protein ACOH19_07405 [Rhodoglobus sp.]